MKQASITMNFLVLLSHFRQLRNLQRTISMYRLILLIAGVAPFISGCHKEEDHSKKIVPLIAVFSITAKTVQANTDVLPELDLITGTGEGTPIGKSTFIGHAEYYPPDFNLTGTGTITSE